MFGLFRNSANDPKALQKRYQKLMDESYKLSHTDRKASDLKRAEAEEVLKQMEALENSQSK